MIARILGAFGRAPDPHESTGADDKQAHADAVMQEPATLLPAGIAMQGLFIIGAARTGTTILQNALNDSADVFLLGEPALHRDPGSADFAARYNAKHRTWNNQETKSSYCPRLFEADACWQAYLARLAELYRYVGSKIVITPGRAGEEAERVLAFQSRHFYQSHYIFTFRNPLDVLMSTRGLAEYNGGWVAGHADVMKGFFEVVALFIRSLRNLPHVHVVFHETVDAEVFARLEQALGIPLGNAAGYYDNRKVRHYALDAVPEPHRALVADAITLYEDFRRAALAGFDLIQIEQNDGHLHPDHFTVLGRLSWRVTRFLANIDAHA